MVTLVEEIFETEIGTFKILSHPEKSNLVFVKTHLPLTHEGVWEDVGLMKKKEFLKLIRSHKPRMKKHSNSSTPSFWDAISTT